MRRVFFITLQVVVLLCIDAQCQEGIASDIVVLKVYNYAQAPAIVLAKAEKVASHIFVKVGLQLRWVQCPLVESDLPKFPDCVRPQNQPELILKVVGEFPAVFGQRADSMGFSLMTKDQPPVNGFVAYTRIRQRHTEAHISEELLFGHVISHEIGHLLLGSNAHSPTGIMTAHWYGPDLQKAERGNLLFALAEASAMRQHVVGRSRLTHQVAGTRIP